MSFSKSFVLIIVAINLFFTSWYALHGEMYFQTEFARDFLLLAEMEEKFILLGPRADAAGLFHGPLWIYINYPVYLLSNGDPIALEFYWIGLFVFFYATSFWIAAKLFDRTTAYLYLILISIFMIQYGTGITHNQAGMIVMPFAFYTLWRYINTLKVKYLAAHVLLAGLLFQFQIAIGIPFIILSFICSLYIQIKKHKLRHLAGYLLLVLPLSTFILFDLRHGFFMTKSFFAYARGNPGEVYVSFLSIVKDRLEYIVSYATPILIGADEKSKILSAIFLGIIIWLTYKRERFSQIYLFILYFLFGYILISLKSRYYLLSQHFLAFVPLMLMMFASLISSKYTKYFVLIFLFVILANEASRIGYVLSYQPEFTDKQNESSWIFQSEFADRLFKGPEKEFGYFIYTPDRFAYSPKYAMVYAQKRHPEKIAMNFEKKAVTYILMAPPPKENPYLSGDFWLSHSIAITKKPQSVFEHPNGYKILRFELSDEEIAVPFDKYADLGISFR